MNCPHCHQTLKPDSRFCTACGTPIEVFGDSETRVPGQNLAPPLQNSDPLLGKVIDAKYQIDSVLGQGGMGRVYRARRVHIGDEVAVKVLHSKFLEQRDAIERFKREARAAAQLRHPNVVVIYDYGEAPAINVPAYIVMELVAGESLGDILDREVKLTPARTLSLFRQICAGVGAAHKRNIIHRDLKPDNVVVIPPENPGDEETVKVVDFGLAKLRDMLGGESLTLTGMVMGTPFYMSPEQCRGEELDPRSDVYSLGAILYEMLRGSRPFVAPSAAAIIAKHLTEPPPSLSVDVTLPRSLVVACDRALAKNPADRPADATTLSRELTLPSTEYSHPEALKHAEGGPLPTVKISGDRPLEIPGAVPSAPPKKPRSSNVGKVAGMIGVLIVVLLAATIGVIWLVTRDRSSTASHSTNDPAAPIPANANYGVVGGTMETSPNSQLVSKILGTWRNRTGKLELRFQESPTGIEGVILKVPDVWPRDRVKAGDSVFAKGKVVGETIEGLYINLPQGTDCQNLETRYSKCVISFDSDKVIKVTNSAWQYSYPECKWSLVTYDDTWNWYKQ